MPCENPFMQGMHAHPCGRCMPCLRQRRRTWTHRIMLESELYSDNAFVTLTYADHPTDGPPVSLNPKHVQDWLKRLRKAAPSRLRFYLVGEYGDESQRPHYHAALFGFPACCNGRTARDSRNVPIPDRCCDVCRTLNSTWGFGHIDCGQLATSSAQYIAGYVLKKMTMRQDPRLNGREPEFARMSNRPGIGHDMMYEVASTMMEFNLELTQADVPVSLRHGPKNLPLGRYLRKKLRGMIGRDEKAPHEILRQQAAEVQAVFNDKILHGPHFSIKDALVEKGKGQNASIAAREKIFKQKRSV